MFNQPKTRESYSNAGKSLAVQSVQLDLQRLKKACIAENLAINSILKKIKTLQHSQDLSPADEKEIYTYKLSLGTHRENLIRGQSLIIKYQDFFQRLHDDFKPDEESMKPRIGD